MRHKIMAIQTKYIIISLFLFIISCEDKSKKNNNSSNNAQDSILKQKKLTNAFEKAKAIFYSLPSPMETSIVLEEAGLKFNEEILNPIQNFQNYNTNKSLALNLGVYSADLSYASLFEQNQITINYLATCKKIADKLGILGAVNDTTINALRKNLKNKSEIMNIISEAFHTSNQYLAENDRSEVATLVVLGGWIEALYLSVKLSNKTMNNKALVETIVDQRLSLTDLINLLEMFKENKDIASILPNIYELKSIYDSISTPVSKENFVKLCSKVEQIRNSYIK